MNNLDKQYTDLLQDILDNGIEKQDRTGTGTLSVFGRQIRHKMSDGFPLLTTKKMPFKSIIVELLWFLRGDTNIRYLLENNCHIWTGDAYKKYYNSWMMTLNDPLSREDFSKKIVQEKTFGDIWGELGPIYGKQWRSWEWNSWPGYQPAHTKRIDQIANLIHDLRTNPDSRRLMVTAWNPEQIDQMVLPPCHYGFQVYTRELSIKERFDLWEKIPTRDVMDFPIGELTEEQYHNTLDQIGVQRRAISLMWNQRSVDTPLGLPFNIASYGLLLEIIAKEVNMVPDELIGNLGDTHIYLNQIEGVKEQLTRESFELPKLKIEDGFDIVSGIEDMYEIDSFKLINYQSHSAIVFPLSN